jgi:ABC-type transport system substrate-binding protein
MCSIVSPRLARLLPALLLPALLVAACRPGEDDAPPLRVEGIGPAASSLVAESVSAGLTARDAAGRIVPGLARSWRVSDDGLSILFRLRDANFASGRRILAADVVASLQRARSGREGALVRDLLAGVTGISAPLDNVVELRLSTPQPELLELLATPPLAVSVRGKGGEAGAFVASAEPANPGASGERRTHLRRNPGYFAADDVALAAATVGSAGAEAALARFNRGETDLVVGGQLDGFGAARVTAGREALVLEQPRAALLLLVNSSKGELARLDVRRALQLAINREALGPDLFGSQAAAAVPGLVPPLITGYGASPPDWTRQPLVARQEEARRLLAQAGVNPVTARLRLTVAVSDSAAETRLMRSVAADVAAVGVDLALERRTPADQARAVAAGAFELALVRRDAAYNSPLPFLLPLRCGANRHGACLPEADRLLAGSWKAPTLAERMAALAAAERLWVDDAVAIGLVQPIDWSLVSQRIGGFVANPGGSHALRHLRFLPDRKLLK